MTSYYRTTYQSGIDTTPWAVIKQAACKIKNCIVVLMSQDEYLSYRQIRYWKGVLLPALAKDTGDSVSYWETRLKLLVLPDEFQPEKIEYKGKELIYLPSIKKLSTKKMNQLIEGSVEKLHSWGFTWVTLPNSELRK
jgi:hypothetical protein